MRHMRKILAVFLVGVFCAVGVSPQSVAQPYEKPPPFLFINQERILPGSRRGQALLAEEDEAREALVAEARAIDAAFEQEELALNERRDQLSPEEFRELAADFDRRVIQARQDQDDKSAELARTVDLERRQFYASVAPILVDLMDRYGANAILDEKSVLLAAQKLNITNEVIAEIDARWDESKTSAETLE